MRIFLTMIAAAMAVVSGPTMAQQVPYGPVTGLDGQRSDWTFRPSPTGATASIATSAQYGASATAYNGFRFKREYWIWDGKQLVPEWSNSGDTTAAYRQGWNDAIAAAAALRKP